MLTCFLPIMLTILLSIPLTVSASLTVFSPHDHDLLPRAPRIDSLICADGRKLTVEELKPVVQADCLRMWSSTLHDRTHAQTKKDHFYRPVNMYPVYFRGKGGCEFSIEYASTHQRDQSDRITPLHKVFLDLQIAQAFNRLLEQCVAYSYGGIYRLEDTFRGQQMNFAVTIGNWQDIHASDSHVMYI